jgi:iron(III) transport system ATP-binding protein
MLDRVSLGDYAASWATKLSGGQQQRLALARALVGQPKLLLLDEPLSNLDAALRKTMRQELKECQRSFGVTTLYVTHDQAEALALSDRLAVLRDGRTIQIGTPREIYERPADPFVARFVGDANVFQGRVIESGARTRVDSVFGVITCGGGADRAAGDIVSCFARPANIRIERVNGSDQNAGHISGKVTALDYVGDRQECTISRGDSELRGWTPADVRLNLGDEASIDLESAGIAILPEHRVQQENHEASPI